MPEAQPPLHRRIGRLIKKRWRAWLRALHRDAGYLAVGLTFVYALSGIAINHIADWNPNFRTGSKTYHIDATLPRDEPEAARIVLKAIGMNEAPVDAYYAGDTRLEIELEGANHSLHVDTRTGTVYEDYEAPRFFLRVANWLHYNRGKSSWTYIADGFAVFLLFLATSGMFMIKGKKGLIGRGAVLVLIGAAVPILYVHFSGGP